MITLHVLGLPHTQVNKNHMACAFTQKILNFCKMMHRTGYRVILYSGPDADTECTENVISWSESDRWRWFGDFDPNALYPINYDSKEVYWQESNAFMIRDISRRIMAGDIICSMGGHCNTIVAEAFPNNKTVEFGIGYTGTFAKFRVFESYPHMHYIYGTQHNDNGGFFDAVIPNYLDPDDFPPNPKTRDERENYGFLGRFIERKGVALASSAVSALGEKLIMAGQGCTQIGDTFTGGGVQISGKHLEHIGAVNAEQRAEFLSGIRALFVPTTYLEPFGAVALEAILCGTPVITTDFGAFSDTIKHGFNGYRVRTVGEAINACKNLEKLASCEEIRENALQNYSLERVAKLYDDYFQQLEQYDSDGVYTRWYGRLDRYTKF